MQDAAALFDALRQTADPATVAAIEAWVREGTDEALARINPLQLAAERGLDEEAVIAALLHATQIGLFEMSWNVLCPSCGGVLDANSTLKTIRQEAYHCAFCALDTEPVLDDKVEVSFTVSPSVRRIAAHDPDSLAFWDYHRQVFFGSGFAFPAPDVFEALADGALIEALELQAGDRMILTLELRREPVIIFDPVSHTAILVLVEGEPSPERQDLTIVFSKANASSQISLRPGALRLALDNRTAKRVLPGVFLAGDDMNTMLGGRRPFLTAKRLLSHQTFRDLYRTDAIAIDQRLKIMSLTFLFTDLKGSTELYERVGDLVAYDLVRAHFRVLQEIVAAHGGAVVKTIGDAVMASFPTPPQAVAAALRMRDAMSALNKARGSTDLMLKIGIHAGPCLAVNLNDRQDYFGQTVNIASRVQELATQDGIFATDTIVSQPETLALLAERHLAPQPQRLSLRGIGDRVPVFEFA